MKNNITIIIVTLVVMGGLTGCTKQSGINSNDTIPTTENTDKSNLSFSTEDYQKLLDLQFDGYEDMTISDFQNQVWQVTDTKEYRTLLERFAQDEALYKLRDTDETAAFLFYELEPLTAENWKTREFGSFVVTDYPEASDNAAFEFFLTFAIQDADVLTVREYNAARQGLFKKFREILQNKSTEQLQDEAFMQDVISTKTDELVKSWSLDTLEITVKYFFTPLSIPEENNLLQNNKEQEPREYPYGTAEDYQSLLKLKTTDYRQMSVADFNAKLLDWGNADYNQTQRIQEDVHRNDFQVELSNEELTFVSLTIIFSNEENYRMIQSFNTGEPEGNPTSIGLRFYKDSEDGAWCTLWYFISYHIADKESATIGERDLCIGGVISGIENFWNTTSLDDLVKLTEEDVVREFRKIASENSNDQIQITINDNQVQFECMDERSI